jgi:hypothetical protein
MEDRLRFILGLCIDWVKFAETKNAALLVAASGLILMLIDHFPDKTVVTSNVRACFWVGGVSLTLSSAICLISFIPHLEIPGIGRKEIPMPDDNLMFFGHIAKYSASEYLHALNVAEGSIHLQNKIHTDLAGQVIANACISLKKFRYFTLASWLAGIGIVSLTIGAIQLLAQ